MADINPITGCRIDGRTKHGMSKTPEYHAWRAIIQRCTIPHHPSYRDYGGRGVSVCIEWRNSFEAFLAYVGKRPSDHHSIDRFPDNNGNYEPGNVRWATREQQSRNRRNNRFLELEGESMVMEDWENRLGICHTTMWRRLKRLPVQDVLRGIKLPFGPAKRLTCMRASEARKIR